MNAFKNWFNRTSAVIDQYQTTHPGYFGKFYALICAIFVTLHLFIAQSFRPSISKFQLLHLHMVCNLLLSCLANWLIDGPQLHPTETNKITLLNIRSLLSLPGFTCHVLGALFLSPERFIVLNNSNLIFGIILTAIFMQVIPNWKVIGLVAVYIFGVVIMIAPDMLGLGLEPVIDGKQFQLWMIIFPLISGFCGGAVLLVLMKFSADITLFQNTFWFAISVCFSSGLVYSSESPVPLTAAFTVGEMLRLPLLAICLVSAQIAISLACRYEKQAAIVGPISSSNILLTFMVNVIVLDAPFQTVNLIGSVVVFISLAAIMIFKDNSK